MRILYFECDGNISADMLTAALIDLGVPIPTVFRALDIPGLNLKVNVFKTEVEGAAATKFEIVNGIDTENTGEIGKIVENSKLKPGIKSRAQKMISTLSGADGATDIGASRREKELFVPVAYCIAAAVCVDYLSPDKVVFSTPLELSSESYRETAAGDGAAIAAILDASFGASMPEGRITCEGRGAGTLEQGKIRTLRACIINTSGRKG